MKLNHQQIVANVFDGLHVVGRVKTCENEVDDRKFRPRESYLDQTQTRIAHSCPLGDSWHFCKLPQTTWRRKKDLNILLKLPSQSSQAANSSHRYSIIKISSPIMRPHDPRPNRYQASKEETAGATTGCTRAGGLRAKQVARRTSHRLAVLDLC